MNLEKGFNNIIKYSFYLLFSLTPLVFCPLNYELFEYPKMMLVYALTAVIMSTWLGKTIVRGKLEIRRTPLDIPLMLYLVSSVLSTIFSLDRYTSLWGYYSRSHGGLISTISYILLYYAFVSNMDKKRAFKTIQILLVSAFLVAFYGILEHFGIDTQYWVQDVRNRVFSTLGQPNWLGAFLTAVIFIPLALLFEQLQKPEQKRVQFKIALYFLLYASYFLCLVFTNSKSAVLAFLITFVFFIIFAIFRERRFFKTGAILLFFTFLVYLLLGNKTYSYIKKSAMWLQIFTNKNVTAPPSLSKPDGTSKPFISESSEIRKVVWQGALEIWRHYPWLGSGLETFGYAYYNFRPQQHNLLSEWDFLYNKAHNEFLNILACQGLVGLITYLLIIITFVSWSAENLKAKFSLLPFAFLCGFLSILITNFFGFSVVITGLLFFFLPGFSFILTKEFKTLKIKFYEGSKSYVWPKTSLGGILLVLIVLLFNLYQRFQSDISFAKGEQFYKTNQLLAGLTSLQKAVQLNPKEALYHAYLSKTAAKLAVVYHEAESTESAKLSQQLSQLALLEIEETLVLNPVHLNFYKNRAEVYLLLSYLKPTLKSEAISSLIRASELAPTDPKILYNLGLLYEQDENYAQTASYYGKAVKLRPNYLEAQLRLAQVLLNTEQKDKAKEILEYVLEKIDPVNKEAKKMLEEVKNK